MLAETLAESSVDDNRVPRLASHVALDYVYDELTGLTVGAVVV
jgi:hypothetical protein